HPDHNPLVFLTDVTQINDAETLFLGKAADLTCVAPLVEVLRETEANALRLIWRTHTERTQIQGQLRVRLLRWALGLAERADAHEVVQDVLADLLLHRPRTLRTLLTRKFRTVKQHPLHVTHDGHGVTSHTGLVKEPIACIWPVIGQAELETLSKA